VRILAFLSQFWQMAPFSYFQCHEADHRISKSFTP